MMYRLGMAMLALMLATTAAAFSLEPKIVGGIAENEPPSYIAFLLLDDAYICGGSYIGDNKILTAAHCVDGIHSAEVFLNTMNGNLYNLNTVRIKSELIRMHPEYNPNTLDNDVAIIFLESPLSESLVPVNLASETLTDSFVHNSTIFTALGWGRTSTTVENSTTNQLQTVDLTYESNSVCRQVYGNLTNNMICAGAADNGKDTCNGDSGGPLVYEHGGEVYLVGLTSFGTIDGCAREGVSGVYARVANYIDWIDSVEISAVKITTYVVPARTGNGSIGFGLLIVLLGGLLVRRR